MTCKSNVPNEQLAALCNCFNAIGLIDLMFILQHMNMKNCHIWLQTMVKVEVHCGNAQDNRTTGPSRATSRPGKPLSRGPITTSFHMRRHRDAEGVKNGETCKVWPLTIWLGVRESIVSFPQVPQRGPGRSQSRKWILCIFEVRKTSGTSFSVFLSDGGAPQTLWGPGKLCPLSPSWRAGRTRRQRHRDWGVRNEEGVSPFQPGICGALWAPEWGLWHSCSPKKFDTSYASQKTCDNPTLKHNESMTPSIS